MQYDFDEIIDRSGTNSLNYEGWKEYIFQGRKDLSFPFKDEEYIRLWVADMAFSTPPPVLDAIRARLDRKILGYTRIYEEKYYEVLRSWFAKRYNWAIDTTEMVTSSGVVPALFSLVPLLTKDDESVLIVTPSYAPFKKASDHHRRKVITSALINIDGHYEMDFEDIKAKIENPDNNIKTFIFCHPHNPTGRVWTREELLTLGEICLANDVWMVSDEIHADILRNGREHIPMAVLFPESDRIITCTAPSKTFNLAGNMLSHIFIKNEAIRIQWKINHPDYHPPLSIVAAQAAYEHGESWLEQLKDYLDVNLVFLQEYLQKYLPKARFEIPEATYLAWVDLRRYIDEVPELTNPALFFVQKAGVVIEDGDMFVDDGHGYIRINVACPRAVLEEGIKRIVQAVNGAL